MVIHYEFTGKCGVEKKGTILFSPKRIIYAFFQSFTMSSKPTGKRILNCLKPLTRNYHLFREYDPRYSSHKTNCIIALCNDIFMKEMGATYFTHKRFGSSRSIPNTYFAANSKETVSYSICLKKDAPTFSSVKAAKGGYVAQLVFDEKDVFSILLTDPEGDSEMSFEEIKEKATNARNNVLKTILKNKKSKQKVVNGIKVNYLTFNSQDVSFEYGLSESLDSLDEQVLQENELLQNGVYIKVLNYTLT